MPKFNFSEEEKAAIVSFLKGVDATGYYPNYNSVIHYNGWVEIDTKMKNKVSILFLAASLVALLSGMLFGILAGLQYIIPHFIKEIMPFNNLRPMHVTSVISWIILAATGGIYYYLSNIAPIGCFQSY